MKDENENTTQFARFRQYLQPDAPLPTFVFAFTSCLLALSVLMRACRPLTGGIDFWAHAAIGRWIWQNARVPDETLFLWGRAPIEWVAHSWGAQSVFALVMRLGDWGPRAAIGLTMMLSLLAWLPLWKRWRQQMARAFSETSQHNALISMCWFTTSVFAALAIYAASPRFKPRPELFSAVLLSVLMWMLLKRRDEAANKGASTCRVVWWLVPIFVVWANMHGAWAWGLVLLGIVIVCDGVQFRCDQTWRSLVLIAVCCVGATLLNPYGPRLWEALGAVRSSTFGLIEEWKSPWESPMLPIGFFVAESVLMLAAALVWLGNPQRKYSDLGWLFFGYFSFLSARRHLWFLALVCVAVWANNLPWAARNWEYSRFWWYLSQRNTILMRASVLGALVASVWSLALSTPRDVLRMRPLHRGTPVAMMQWLRAHPNAGRVWNDYEWSSYGQWALAGHPPLYIDLLNAYPDALMLEYFDVLAMNARGLQVLAKVNTVVSRPSGPREQLRKFHQYLDARPRVWKRVYKGVDGTIWRRVKP